MTDHRRVLEALPKARGSRNDDDYMAHCPGPSHKNGDRKPSLHVTYNAGQDRVVMRCFGGCMVEEVLDAAGLTWQDVLPERGEAPQREARKGSGFRTYYSASRGQ